MLVSSISKLARYYKRAPDKISREELKSYIYYLIREKQAAPSTINQLISAWKILQIDILNTNWEKIRIKRPKKQKRIPQILSQQEALKLIDTPRNFKHRILLKLAYVTGLRRSELLSLALKDIDSSRNVIRVINGKGNKSREVPVPDIFIPQLREYYSYYHPKTFLFEGTSPGKPYSASSFYKIVKQAAIKAGIKKNIYPHILRHSFSTHMLERGVNLKRLQIILGHNSMKTTSVYLHLSNPNQSDLPNLLSPEK